jgi:hypothetical protein
MSTTTAKQPAAARERAWTVDRRASTVQFRRRSHGESRSCSWGCGRRPRKCRAARARGRWPSSTGARTPPGHRRRSQSRRAGNGPAAGTRPSTRGRRRTCSGVVRSVTAPLVSSRARAARRTRAEQANGRDPARPRGASPLRRRIDHNVGELAEPAVGAVDAAANLESHLTPLVPHTLRSAAAGRLPSTARSLPQRPRAACRWRWRDSRTGARSG